jgi:hypothetical protein
MSIFGAAKRGFGLLGKLGPKPKPRPTAKPRPQTKHEKEQAFANLDPYERGAIISRRESAKRGDVYTGTSIVGTPSPHRSAKAIKKYSGPHSYQLTDPARKRRGPKAAGGRIGFKKGKRIGMRTEAGKIADKRQRLYEQAHGEFYTTGLFGRKKSDASTGGGAPPPLRLLTGMKNYWQGKPNSLKQLRKFNKENPPPKDSKYQLKKGGKV